MAQMMASMKDAFKDVEITGNDDEPMGEDAYDVEDDKDEEDMDSDEDSMTTEDNEKKPNVIIDSTVYFNEIMAMYKDSIAALPKDQRLAMETLKDMYMTIKSNEDEGIYEMGIGLKFSSIEELKNIKEKIEAAKNMNPQNGQYDDMAKNSPFKGLMGDDDNEVVYSFTEMGFTRTTTIAEITPEEQKEKDEMSKFLEDGGEEAEKEFESAFYVIEYTFPKKIRSTSLKGATISEDGKTISYKMNYMVYVTNPNALDFSIQF